MNGVAMTGADTLVLNNRTLNDFGTGDIAMLTFPNEKSATNVGKNGNAVFAFNAKGTIGELKIKVLRGSSDDQFLNALMNQQDNNFAAFALMFGNFVKKVGDGSGNITNDTYDASGGLFMKGLDGKSNVEGNTDQSEVEYGIRFSKVVRAIG